MERSVPVGRDGSGDEVIPFRLRLRGPAGWRARESVTLVSPDGQADVMASTEPVDPVLTTFEYARAVGERLRRDCPGFRELACGTTPVAGLPGYRRDFTWDLADGRQLWQAQVYLVLAARGTTATATAPSATAGEFADVFEAAFASLLVDEVPSPASAVASPSVPRVLVPDDLLRRAVDAAGWEVIREARGPGGVVLVARAASDGHAPGVLHTLTVDLSGATVRCETEAPGRSFTGRRWWHALESVNAWNCGAGVTDSSPRARAGTAAVRPCLAADGGPAYGLVVTTTLPAAVCGTVEETVDVLRGVHAEASAAFAWAQRERGL